MNFESREGFYVENGEIVGYGSYIQGTSSRWLPFKNLENHRSLFEKNDVYYYLRLYKNGVVNKDCILFFKEYYGIGCLGLVSFFTRNDLSKILDPDLALLYLKTIGKLDVENETQVMCEKLRRIGVNLKESDVFIDDSDQVGSVYVEPRLKRQRLFSGMQNYISNERQALLLLTLHTDEIWFCDSEEEIRSEIYKRYSRFINRDRK